MEQRPRVRYATTFDGTHIAYQVSGAPPLNLVYMPHWASNVEVMWENGHLAYFLKRLGGFARLIMFDKRGVGLSDPVAHPHMPPLESWVDDTTAVLDEVGVDRTTIVAHGVGGLLAILFAASHPERTSSLVLINSTARFRRAPDYPEGLPDHLVDRFVETMLSNWGSEGHPLAVAASPSLDADSEEREFVARYQRASASPGVIAQMMPLTIDADVRALLPSIRVPTLVLHRLENPYMRIGHGRYLGSHVEGARYVELPGPDHDPEAGDSDALIAEIQEFLTGERPTPVSDRVLATLVFTDVVASTQRVASLGDAAWRRVLDRLEQSASRLADQFRGDLIKSTGDGHLVVFDAPGRAIQWARAVMESARGLEIELRAGIHSGEIERRGADIAGLAVHIASRVADLSAGGQILVTSTVKDLVVGSGLEFAVAGSHNLKGVPGAWDLFVFNST